MYEQSVSIGSNSIGGASTGYLQKQAYSGPVQPADVGHVAQGMNEYDRLVSALSDEIGLLEQRINGVLRPTQPTPASAGGVAPAALRSNLAEGLDQFNGRLSYCVQRIREMAARADI